MILKTKRLILRKPKPSDWKDVVEGVGEYDVAKMTAAIPHPYGEKDAKDYIKKRIKIWKSKNIDDYLFFIELKSEKKIIGAMGIHKVNKFSGIGGTGSWINKKYWRKGYITEAKVAANDFAFNALGLHRLSTTVFKDNKASNATQRKTGYRLEGMKRKGERSRASGKIHDVNVYGLLKEDWVKVRPKIVKWLAKKSE